MRIQRLDIDLALAVDFKLAGEQAQRQAAGIGRRRCAVAQADDAVQFIAMADVGCHADAEIHIGFGQAGQESVRIKLPP